MNKYERAITSIKGGASIAVDVYCVLEAFRVTCPARQHAIKKLLCAGLRDKGTAEQDLRESLAAIERAIELEASRLHFIESTTP